MQPFEAKSGFGMDKAEGHLVNNLWHPSGEGGGGSGVFSPHTWWRADPPPPPCFHTPQGGGSASHDAPRLSP